MALTYRGIIATEPYALTKDGVTYGNTHLIVSNDGTDNEVDAMALVDVALGEQLGSVPAKCIYKHAVYASTDRKSIHVVLKWGRPEKEDEDKAPWERPRVREWDFTHAQEAIIKDVSGNLIMNSAKDGYKGLERDAPRVIFRVQKYAETFDFSVPIAYCRAINNASWNGGNTATWRVMGIKVKDEYDEQWGSYFDVNYEFEFRPDTHDIIILDAGLNQIVDGKKTPCVRGTESCQEPQALNGSGVMLAEGSTSFVYNTFEQYNRMSFSIFNGLL